MGVGGDAFGGTTLSTTHVESDMRRKHKKISYIKNIVAIALILNIRQRLS
jgi:hypothetical protein